MVKQVRINLIFPQNLKSKKLSKRTKQTNLITDAKSQSAQAIASIFNLKEDQQLRQLNLELEARIDKLKAGNCEDIEELLLTQASTLNCLFTQLTIKGFSVLASPAIMISNPNLPESLLNLALKAQNQSRRTLQAISEIKNPKRSTTFVKNYIDKQLNQLSVTEQESEQPLELGEATNAPLDINSLPAATRANKETKTLEV